MLTCPFCQGSHPATTVRCPVTGAMLPRRKTPPSPESGEPEASSDVAADDRRERSSLATSEPDIGGSDPHAGFLADQVSQATGVTDVVLRLPNGERVQVARGASVRLGREASPIADICSDNVSRHHADVRADPNRVVVVDAGSINGTFVNDRRLAPGKPQPILPGDTIRLASDPPVLLHVARTG